MIRDEFMHRFFVDAQGIQPSDQVTRIEWTYVGKPAEQLTLV